MNTRLRYRLERLEAQARQARRSVIRIGIVRCLPYDFVGERHIAAVEPGAPGRPAGRSRFDKRSSISSISIALAAWLKIESATRARTDAGVLGSISSFSSVVAAADVPC